MRAKDLHFIFLPLYGEIYMFFSSEKLVYCSEWTALTPACLSNCPSSPLLKCNIAAVSLRGQRTEPLEVCKCLKNLITKIRVEESLQR